MSAGFADFGASDASEKDWWYRGITGKTGPFTSGEIQQLANEGTVKEGTMIWHKDFGAYWKPLKATGIWKPEEKTAGPPPTDLKWELVFSILEKGMAGGKLSFKERWKTYSLTAAAFGPFYYFAKGMHRKGFIILAVAVLMATITQFIESIFSIDFRSGLLSSAAQVWFGLYAYKDLYKMRVQGETMWPALKVLDSPVKSIATFGISLILLASLAAFMPTPSDIFEDMSGVWKDDDNGMVVKLDLARPVKRITVGSNAYAVSPIKADTATELVVLKSSKEKQVFNTITLRKIIDGANRSFTLRMTIDDTNVSELSYIRPL